MLQPHSTAFVWNSMHTYSVQHRFHTIRNIVISSGKNHSFPYVFYYHYHFQKTKHRNKNTTVNHIEIRAQKIFYRYSSNGSIRYSFENSSEKRLEIPSEIILDLKSQAFKFSKLLKKKLSDSATKFSWGSFENAHRMSQVFYALEYLHDSWSFFQLPSRDIHINSSSVFSYSFIKSSGSLS